jgi:adenosylcobinamide kinase/adenosylcobinamide-phosphate guanylyltransferase
MARIALVTGGCRSGKSDYAQRLAESLPPPRLYVATCPVIDDEMALRIERHRRSRCLRDWQTVEEPIDLCGVFRTHAHYSAILVDCVTLWINNQMYQAELEKRRISEEEIVEKVAMTLEAASEVSGVVIFVTNEIGWGIVPDNPQARCYRDLIGRANQALAARAESVTLVCCGIPMQLKGLVSS